MMCVLTRPGHRVSDLSPLLIILKPTVRSEVPRGPEPPEHSPALPRVQGLMSCRRSLLLKHRPCELQKMNNLSVQRELSLKDWKGAKGLWLNTRMRIWYSLKSRKCLGYLTLKAEEGHIPDKLMKSHIEATKRSRVASWHFQSYCRCWLLHLQFTVLIAAHTKSLQADLFWMVMS